MKMDILLRLNVLQIPAEKIVAVCSHAFNKNAQSNVTEVVRPQTGRVASSMTPGDVVISSAGLGPWAHSSVLDSVCDTSGQVVTGHCHAVSKGSDCIRLILGVSFMPPRYAKLEQAVEDYFIGLRLVRSSGGATGERSLYGPLGNLMNAVGETLGPKVFCVQELADQGVDHPDLGLYTMQQVQKGKVKTGQKPERGVIEVKPVADEAWLKAESEQVAGYWQGYRQVLVTNARDFVLVGEDAAGHPVVLESLRLADSAAEFDAKLEHPRAFANKVGAGLGEYLTRVLSHAASLAEPRDVAWLLASYARDGLGRVERAGDATSLATLRQALEESLGVVFEGDRGAAFFRSTLVQTLFYGVFSAWVLWARQTAPPTGLFNWHDAVWLLRAPVLRALFQQLSDPGKLQPLGLVEVLDWTANALNRVERGAFFAKFNEGEAVPYFYEPFLQAFDPDLRKQLGVWYTPAEVVRYMVARVDKALKDDLGIPDGLASENVYVPRPLLRHRSVPGGGAPPHRREPAGKGTRRADRRTGETGRDPARLRFRDHAGSLCGGPPAGRADHAGTGRAAVRGRRRTRRRLPHQRPHRLGGTRSGQTSVCRA